MITINGKEIPNLVSEMTLFQYEHISHILNNKSLDNTEKYMKIFLYLGADEEYLNGLNFESEFLPLVKEYANAPGTGLTLTKSFELEGYTYRASADDESYSVKVPDMKEIEKALKNEKYLCAWMAVVFKREDLTGKEHFAPAHLKQKAKLFRQISAEIAVPYVVIIGQIFRNALQAKNNELVEDNSK